VKAALAAYSAGQGSEHAALAALAASRLLVPVVAVLTEQEPGDGGPRREKVSEMALPTLIGRDGRPAFLAFSCLDALARWRPGARPVPVPAAGVWEAAAAEASAVVIDVAGPVPVAVDGARLAALANGEAVPPAHEDPDVIALAGDLVEREQALAGFSLGLGEPGTDMTLHVTLAPGLTATGSLPRGAIGRVVAGIMAGAGPRVRRGLTVAASEAAPADRRSGHR
jgi:SseB protein N-terminal domain